MPSLSEILSGFKRTTSSTAPARAGLSWATEAVKPVNKTNAEALKRLHTHLELHQERLDNKVHTQKKIMKKQSTLFMEKL